MLGEILSKAQSGGADIQCACSSEEGGGQYAFRECRRRVPRSPCGDRTGERLIEGLFENLDFAIPCPFSFSRY